MASLDLYEFLGIPKTASKSQVNATYRRKAKKAHPDGGGSDELFTRLNRARAVLIDDSMRAHYDATGEIGEKEPDNLHAEAGQQVCNMFQQILAKCDEENMDPLGIDIIAASKEGMRIGLEMVQKQIAEVEKNKRKAARLLGRSKVKSGKVNMFERMIEQRIHVCEREIEKLRHDQQVGELAMVMISDYTFVGDAASSMANMMVARGFGPTVNTTTTW